MADQFRNARLAFIQVDAQSFLAEDDMDFQINGSTIETTNKSVTDARTRIFDVYDATVQVGVLTKLDDTAGTLETSVGALYTDITTGTSATILVVLQASAPTTTISGSYFCTNWNVSASQENVLRGSFSFESTGALTKVETTT